MVYLWILSSCFVERSEGMEEDTKYSRKTVPLTRSGLDGSGVASSLITSIVNCFEESCVLLTGELP